MSDTRPALAAVLSALTGHADARRVVIGVEAL